MAEEASKEYSNGEITIVWKPRLCIHSGVCVKTLPEVYKPDEKPWIQINNASTDALKSQVNKCPSGALSYYVNDGDEPEEAAGEIKVEVTDGPLMVYGTLRVKKLDGSEETRQKVTAFCRCGASGNKPFCDGTHKKSGFGGS